MRPRSKVTRTFMCVIEKPFDVFKILWARKLYYDAEKLVKSAKVFRYIWRSLQRNINFSKEKREQKNIFISRWRMHFFLCEYILVRERLLFCTFDVLFTWSIKIVINRFVRAINLYWVYGTLRQKFIFYPKNHNL